MSTLVVGSIAIDSVETPWGKDPEAYGGSALFFSVAASLFSPVNMVGVVGEDFAFEKIDFLKDRSVGLEGVSVEPGKTFRWGGRYHENMNKRDTLFTDLNVFENFAPVIPDHYRNNEFIFLANIQPDLQEDVLEQVHQPKLTVLDTMNLWIDIKPEELKRVVSKVNVVIMNDDEIKQYSGLENIFDGARQIMAEGPDVMVVKKGEHGAVLITEDDLFLAPAYPIAKVVDPTGAGDSFAGGFVGYLASQPEINTSALRESVIYGSTVASFTVEDFSFNRLKEISREDVEARVNHMRNMTQF